jgi:succinate-acetate transporter protein
MRLVDLRVARFRWSTFTWCAAHGILSRTLIPARVIFCLMCRYICLAVYRIYACTPFAIAARYARAWFAMRFATILCHVPHFGTGDYAHLRWGSDADDTVQYRLAVRIAVHFVFAIYLCCCTLTVTWSVHAPAIVVTVMLMVTFACSG